MYAPLFFLEEGNMERTAKIVMTDGSQAVLLPKDFQFSTSKVFIRRQGDEVVLSERPTDWSELLSGPAASEEYMENVDDPPPQERESLKFS
jgi:antitoxin VapB